MKKLTCIVLVLALFLSTAGGVFAAEETVVKVEGVTATVLSQTSAELTWEPIDGASFYWVMINDVCYTGTTEPGCILRHFVPEETYEVYVTARLADGTVLKKADAQILTVDTSAFIQPVVKVEGVTATVLSQTSAELIWEPIDGASFYWVMINDVCYTGTTEPGCILRHFVPEETYEVYVTARLADGTVLKKADAQILTVDTSDFTPPVVKVEGVTATVLSQTTAQLSWTPIADASIYWIMVNDRCYTGITDTACTLKRLDPAQIYEVYVIAKLADGTVLKKADADVLSVNTAPPAVKVEGVTATVLSETTAQLSWNPIPGASVYWVMVNDRCYTGITDTVCTLKRLNPAEIYEVYVIAKMPDGRVLKKEEAELLTVNTAPPAVKVEGVKAEVLSQTSARVSWEPTLGALKYWVMINDLCYTSTTDTACTLGHLLPEETYEVYVIAKLANGTVQKKADAELLTITTAPPAVKVEGVMAAVNSDTSITIRWDPLPRAEKYWVMINDLCYTGTDQTLCTMDHIDPRKTNEIYVIAKMTDGRVLKKADADLLHIKTEKIVGLMDEGYGITLDNALPAGAYTLKYEDEQGVMANCLAVCTLEKTQNEVAVVYESFIPQNIAPSGCIKIGVYNSENRRMGYIELPESFQKQLSGKLYSFSATSDIHLGYSTAEADFIKALQYFNNTEQVDFHMICGDLAVSGQEAELQNFKALLDRYSPDTQAYVAAGNHEEYAANSSGYYETYTGNPLYYYFTKGEDVYIVVGIISTHEDRLFAEGELQWLYEVLEANRNKRCFVFQHIPVEGGSGDPLNALQDRMSKLAKEPTSVAFKNLLSHYKNVIHFHGHSHFQLASQEYDKLANYDNIFGGHSVHIPSLSNPRVIDPTGNSSFLGAPEDAEGYVVDVYENGIVLRGVDIVQEKLIPVAQYYLDTTIREVAPNSFTDSTGIIIP